MKKRLIILIFVTVILIASVAMFSGCYYENPESFEDCKIQGDFVYADCTREFKGKTYEGICLVTLSDEGKLKERIDLPIQIDGKPVIQIGRRTSYRQQMVGDSDFFATYFNSIKVKKYVVPWQIMMYSGEYDVKAMWRTALGTFKSKTKEADKAKIMPEKIIFVNNNTKLYNDNALMGEGDWFAYVYNENCFYVGDIPNISYIYNFENAPNDGIFYKDDLEVGEKLFEPSLKPTRDGYRFVGWYKDAESQSAVDFATETKGLEKIQLYAKWQEIKEN